MSKKEYEIDWEDTLDPIIMLITPKSDNLGARIKSFAKAKEKAIEGIWEGLREFVEEAESQVKRINEMTEEEAK